MLKILYICDKKQYDLYANWIAGSRAGSWRTIEAIAEVVYSGVGWKNYDSTKTIQENVLSIYGNEQPDIIVFSDLNKQKYKQCRNNIPICFHETDLWRVGPSGEAIKL